MKCEGYRVLITGYIDGELSDREMHTLKMHLNECNECLQHLQRQEKMQAMFKRYSLVQEHPVIPEHFASTITEHLHGNLQEKQAVSFLKTWTERYQRFAFRVIEGLIRSLKVRPLAWTASMSSVLVLLAGILFFELYQYSSKYTIPQFSRQIEYGENESLLVASIEEDEVPLFGDMEQESLIVFEDSEIPVDETSSGDSAQVLSRFVPSYPATQQQIVKAASHNPDPVEDYVYSHVMEVYQERLVEDVVLVGYVQ